MAEAYIVAAKRTAGGRRNGRLAGVHPADLGAASVNAVLAYSGIDPAAVEDVIVGCVTQASRPRISAAMSCWHHTCRRACRR